MASTPLDQPVTLRTARRLSPTQRAFLASQLRHPTSTSMNMAWLVTFGVPIDQPRWANAFDAVVASSDVLRTQIVGGERNTGEVAADPTSATERTSVPRDNLDEWAQELGAQPLDLSQSVYRSVLADHEDGTTSWFLNIHHIATDAATSKAIVERTVAAYLGAQQIGGQSDGRPLEFSGSGASRSTDPLKLLGELPEKSNFYRWSDQITKDASPRALKRRAFWDERLPAPRIGQLYRKADRIDSKATRLPIETSPEQSQALTQALSQSYRLLSPELSLAGLLVTASAIYLHRLTGSTDFAIGLPVHQRNTTDTEKLLGPTVGVYPVDIHIEPHDTNASLHRRIARSMMTVLGNADPSVTPPGDYDAVVNVIPTAAPVGPKELPLTATWIHTAAIDPEHVMRVQATDYGERAGQPAIGLDLDILNQVADETQRARAPQHFSHILQAAATTPDASIYEAQICTQEEHSLITSAEHGPARTRQPQLLANQLQTALEGNPDVVLESSDQELTGIQAWQWVTHLAADIHAKQPAGSRVAIHLEPSIEAVIAIYACVVAGRSFVPIDPAQPAARTATLNARAGVVRSFQNSADVQAFDPRLHGLAPVQLPPSASSDDEAYLLFTSGSTGVPKGVPITHGGLAGYIDFAVESYFDIKNMPVAALFTALTFDLTITTVFAPVVAGGRIRALDATGPAAVAELAATPEINWCKATPSHLEILLSLLEPEHQLNTCVVGGEAFRSDLAERLLGHNPAMQIFNEYGPTEAVVGCMIYQVDPATNRLDASVPIGMPAPGVELRVVDPGLERVPLGAAGELLISHDGMAAGYLAAGDEQPDVDPFIELDDKRFYRSGDLVVRNADLGLTYLGRIDEQIKVGGVRLDPAEVEAALLQHPSIASAAVRVWTPSEPQSMHHCTRCGLPSNVPRVLYDEHGVCTICHEYDRIAPIAESWFGTEEDLVAQFERTVKTSDDYDCLHLLSGGKDSTYALYRLVELGLRPYAVTLDNGFISEGALENCRRVAEHLGIEYEVLTTPHMDAIFRDSLATFSDVCHGCYKTIYTLATNKAIELNIPVIVTGLSRGQLFETRLIPAQFQQDRFDAVAVDRAVVEARKRYHRTNDLPNRVLDTSVFETDDIFESLSYIDIYRYLDVELTEVLRFLAEETPWERPADTGRSSNCLINIAGIHAHQVEQGYHNYAEPYAWDVRLGHKRRDESMAELDDPVDMAEIDALLKAVGYAPAPKQILTGWYQVAADADRPPTPTELRSFLINRLPVHSIPAAFVGVDELTTTANGKLDVAALPAPDREHRAAIGAYLAPESELQASIITKWEAVLGVQPISVNDDFFALGGDSLAAVTMIIELSDELDMVIREELGFSHTTPRSLADAIQAITPDERDTTSAVATGSDPTPRDDLAQPPELSAGELSVLIHQQARPTDVMYNVGRTFTVNGAVDPARFEQAVRDASARHEPLTWSYGSPRRKLLVDQAVAFESSTTATDVATLATSLASFQRAPFDLENGPLLRCKLQPQNDGSTAVAIAIHHVSGDHGSLDQLWTDIDRAYQGQTLRALTVGYGDFCAWQRDNEEPHRRFWADQGSYPDRPTFGGSGSGTDGYLTTNATITSEQLRSAAGRTPVANVVGAAAAAASPFFRGEEVEVNLVSSTRDHDVACELVGYMLNPLPLRLSHSNTTRIGEMAAMSSTMIGAALPHRSYPFASIITEIGRTGEQPPSGSVLVSYSDDPVASLAGVPVQQRMLFNGSAVADVSFFVEPRADHVNLGVEYRGTAVSEQTAQLILDRFDHALTAAVLDQSTSLDELPATEPSVLCGSDLGDHELFVSKLLRNVERHHDEVAVEVGEHALTWKQLGARASQLAAELAARNIGLGDRVAVQVSRSTELPIAIAGVMLAGASYVPVDPSYPADRIAATIDRSDAAIQILTTAEESTVPGNQLLITSGSCGNTVWDDSHVVGAMQDVAAADEAYVIFTSGSTGQANGVAITHGQLAASTNARSQFYDGDPARFLMLSSIAFDSSIVGLFWSMASAGTLVLPTEDMAHDIDRLSAYLTSARLSHVLCVPTLYDALLDRGSPADGWPRHVIVAGEACAPRLVARHFAAAPTTALTNEYGPTEASVWSTAHHCTPEDAGSKSIPIGRPIPGTWLAVTDPTGTVAPAGITGQLVLGGPNIAAGYIGDENSTRFATAAELQGLPPGYEGQIFYTGDRVAILGDTVHFFGRLDDQLNVGGARVEPTDIERNLLAVDGVASAVVVAADIRTLESLFKSASADQAARAMRVAADTADPTAALRRALSEYGRRDQRLVAHVVTASSVDEAALRAAVSGLPANQRPSIYRVHDSLPLLPNGKVDRVAAQQLDVQLDAPPTVAPGRTDLVETVTAFFRQALHTSDIGPSDSFFDMGGDSLRALELLRTIEAEIGVRLATSAIHETPTAAGLAETIARAGSARPTLSVDPTDNTIVMTIQPRGDRTPIFALHNLGPNGAMWRPMSSYLGEDQPLYGIADPFALLDPFGDNYNLEHRPEIHETATRYVEHIQRITPTGPVVLLGFCLGGVFGYEVAQQLRAAGREVENFIIVLDWHAPHLEYQENWITLTKLSYRRSNKSLGTHIVGVLQRRAFLKAARRRVEGYAVRAATKLKLPLWGRLRNRQYVEEGIHRIHSYVYEPYPGRITVVRSSEDPRIPTDLGTSGWGNLVADLRVDYVPGVGERMLHEPYVERATQVVRDSLTR